MGLAGKIMPSRESRLHGVPNYVDVQPLSAYRESSQKPFRALGTQDQVSQVHLQQAELSVRGV
eukprot:2072572-Karenia_brevis.AAC.1